MMSLRDQLLKAGLVTEDQVAKAEAATKKGGRRSPGGRDRPRGQGPKPGQEGAEAKPKQPQPSKKSDRPGLPRMLDMSDPIKLQILQAIEAHRVRVDTKGEVPFYFPLRDGRVRKMFVTQAVMGELEAGKLAIVEHGEVERHILVAAEAVSAIREADPEAVRFFNPS